MDKDEQATLAKASKTGAGAGLDEPVHFILS
jgi:hypothetical protein